MKKEGKESYGKDKQGKKGSSKWRRKEKTIHRVPSDTGNTTRPTIVRTRSMATDWPLRM